jgi:hypothetical protein
MKATLRASQEKMATAIHSIWSELEETIKNRVEDFWQLPTNGHETSARR